MSEEPVHRSQGDPRLPPLPVPEPPRASSMLRLEPAPISLIWKSNGSSSSLDTLRCAKLYRLWRSVELVPPVVRLVDEP